MGGGLSNPISEKYTNFYYAPNTQSTPDLESATKTITATTEAEGVANKDYSGAMTIPIPTDSRLAILRVCSRLSVTIDSMTATHLYCKVYVDAQDADHLLFSEDFTTTGAKLDAVDLHASNKAILFNLLKDGTPHTFYFFFYVDAGNAVLSVARIYAGPGTCATGTEVAVLSLTAVGTATISQFCYREGTGTLTAALYNLAGRKIQSSAVTYTAYNLQLSDGFKLYMVGTVATDINGLQNINIELRQMQ